MLVSIIVPCYNAEKYLNECLQSIKKQTFTDWEAVCIDDGSHDKTREILERFAEIDARFIVASQTNQGVSVTRNNALRRCRGEYICFVDSDDTVEPDFLDTLIAMMKNHVDLVICGFTRKMTAPNEKENAIGWLKKGYECAEKIILDRSFSPQLWCMMFKKNIIDQYNLHFYPNCARAEDWEFYMKYLAHSENVMYSNRIIYHYRKNETSAMAQLNSKSLTSIEASERVSSYYDLLNNKACNIVKQYSVPGGIWKFSILSLLRHDMNLYKVIKSKYDVEAEMYKLYSYPGMIQKISSRLYVFSEFMFRCCFYLLGFVYRPK